MSKIQHSISLAGFRRSILAHLYSKDLLLVSLLVLVFLCQMGNRVLKKMFNVRMSCRAMRDLTSPCLCRQTLLGAGLHLDLQGRGGLCAHLSETHGQRRLRLRKNHQPAQDLLPTGLFLRCHDGLRNVHRCHLELLVVEYGRRLNGDLLSAWFKQTALILGPYGCTD